MKTLLNILPAILLLGLLANVSYGQSGYTSISYQVAVPFGGTANYVDKSSFRGIGVEGGVFFTPRFSLGISGNWQVFYQNMGLRTIDLSESTTLNGVEYRYINSFPLFVQGRYFTREGDGIIPFVGLGVGSAYNKQETQIGGYALTQDGWQFGLYPEAGISFQAGNKRMLLGARYNYGFKTNQLPDLSYLTIRLGVIFSQWQ